MSFNQFIEESPLTSLIIFWSDYTATTVYINFVIK